MLRVMIITLFCFGWLYSTGQKIQNLNASFLDGKAIVTYDVIGTKANQTYTIDLYSSHNNFASPLKNVTGDVGKNIKAGTGKKIIWDAASELTEFSGDISFKIKGELIPLPLAGRRPRDRARRHARGASPRRPANARCVGTLPRRRPE